MLVMIVNGQSTTDDIDKEEIISSADEELAQHRARIERLENQLSATITANQQQDSS